MLNGKGVGAPSSMQCAKRPCLHPSAISQSLDARPIIISIMTMIPHMKAITWDSTEVTNISEIHKGSWDRKLRELFIKPVR